MSREEEEEAVSFLPSFPVELPSLTRAICPLLSDNTFSYIWVLLEVYLAYVYDWIDNDQGCKVTTCHNITTTMVWNTIRHQCIAMFLIIFSNSIPFDIPTGKLHMAVLAPRSSVPVFLAIPEAITTLVQGYIVNTARGNNNAEAAGW